MGALWKEPPWLLPFVFLEATASSSVRRTSMLQDATLCRITVVEITMG
jgi:hypothetical protein